MRVTEQLDALRVMGADPIAYLVVPRVIACLIMVPILTVISDLLGIFGGYLVVVRGFGVDSGAYWTFSERFVDSWDIYNGLIKSVVFGGAIGVISCYKGFNCQSGAAGVYISVGPSIEIDPRQAQVTRAIDPSFLLVETDSPVEYAGHSARPAWAERVAKALAEARREDLTELKQRLAVNLTRYLSVR